MVEPIDSAAPDLDQQLLRAVLAAGTVREFAPERPSLVELYRDVVSSEPKVEV